MNEPNPTPGQMPRYAGHKSTPCKKTVGCQRASRHDGNCNTKSPFPTGGVTNDLLKMQ